MVDLLPVESVAILPTGFGARFGTLEQDERLTLAAAAAKKVVTHAQIREITALHPFDSTHMFQKLVRNELLEPHNQGRGSVYCLTGSRTAHT